MRPILTATGHLIFVSPEGDILAAPLDTETMEFLEEPVRLVDGVSIGILSSPM